MNSYVYENQTSHRNVSCSVAQEIISGVAVAMDFIINLPMQIWVLKLGMNKYRKQGHLPSSEILTMVLAAQELLSSLLNPVYMVAFAFNIHEMILFVLFFSGIYIVGRPLSNSLICVERYVAVAHPALYRNPLFVKLRWIAAFLVWMLIVADGGFDISIYPTRQTQSYMSALAVSILVIAACSLGVLKVLLRPSPGEAQKEKMHRQKKRAFAIITGTLVCISSPYLLDLIFYSTKKNIDVELFCVVMASNMFFLQGGSVIQSALYLVKHEKFACFQKVCCNTVKNAGSTGS